MVNVIPAHSICRVFIFLGEFGLVYHAVYNEPNAVPRAVAVKTLKGSPSSVNTEMC